MKFLKSIFKKSKEPKVKTKLVVEKINIQLKNKSNFEKQKKIISTIIALEKKITGYNRESMVKYSKILAREILITETFINRLRKESKRPIVVVGIERTGVPYTWSVKEKEGVYLSSLKYSSCKHNLKNEQIKNLNNFIKKKKENLKDPLFFFIDSSTRSKMPSSFTGCNIGHSCSISSKDAIKSVLKKENPKFIGYDWSLKNKQERLPKEINLRNVNTILFNPVGIGKNPIKYSAFHDDINLSHDFKRLTEKRVELLKLQWFGE